MLGCSQGRDLHFEKLLHLQITSTSSPRTAVSQGVRRWHLLHTEPGAATLGEQEKVMAQSSPPKVLSNPVPCPPAELGLQELQPGLNLPWPVVAVQGDVP